MKVEKDLVDLTDAEEEVMAVAVGAEVMVGSEEEAAMDEGEDMEEVMVEAAETEVMTVIEAPIGTADRCQSKKDKKWR